MLLYVQKYRWLKHIKIKTRVQDENGVECLHIMYILEI